MTRSRASCKRSTRRRSALAPSSSSPTTPRASRTARPMRMDDLSLFFFSLSLSLSPVRLTPPTPGSRRRRHAPRLSMGTTESGSSSRQTNSGGTPPVHAATGRQQLRGGKPARWRAPGCTRRCASRRRRASQTRLSSPRAYGRLCGLARRPRPAPREHASRLMHFSVWAKRAHLQPKGEREARAEDCDAESFLRSVRHRA